jgi:hypothetical protein
LGKGINGDEKGERLHGNIKIYVDTCDIFVSQYSCNDGKDRRKELFLYWYQVDGAYTTDFFLYKIKVI